MKLLSFRQAITISSLAFSALIVPGALAADYIVSTPTTAQNGVVGNILDGSDSLTVTGAGSIATSADFSNAIHASGNLNTISNAGSVTTNGNAANGIYSANNLNNISNSGTIDTKGGGSVGISIFGDGNTITNTGTIITSGAGAYGIMVTGDENIVNNSGKVVSSQSSSFFFLGGGGTTLNLSAPSFIGGDMFFGPDDMVNITTGRSHSVLWDFTNLSSDPAASGPVPWAWDAVTRKFATIDPTALSAAPDVLADTVGSLSDLTRANAQDGRWWLNGYGNFSGYGAQTIYNDYNTLNGAIATGASFALNDNFTLGAMAGYMATNLTVNSKWMTSQTIKGNGIVGGIYGSARADNLFADFSIFAGGQNNLSSRLVNDNLAPLGVDYATANYNSWFVSPQVRIGLDIKTDGGWTLTPSASGRFSSQQIAAYSETGSNANATIAQRQVQVFDGNLELAATRKLENGSITLKGGAQYRKSLGGASQNVTLLGQTLAIPVNNAGFFSGYAGLGADFALTDTSTLNLSAQGAIGQNNFKSLTALVGFNNKLL